MTATLAEPITGRNWRQHALCKPHTSDLFTPGPHHGKARPPGVGEALALCNICPVIDWCEQWRAAQLAIDKTALSGQVVAGIYHE